MEKKPANQTSLPPPTPSAPPPKELILPTP